MLDEKEELNAKEEFENGEIQFYSLIPNQINEESIYLKALDCAMQDEEVCNIAITGKSGSGKSSVIKTYEKLHKEHKYVNVSLASFDKVKQENNQIEKSILQQIFYSVDSKKIPYSKFKRIKNVEKDKLAKKISVGLLVLILIIMSVFLLANPQLINYNTFKAEIVDKYFSSLEHALITIGLVILMVTSIGWAVYKICEKILKKIELSNIKLKNDNVEIKVDISANRESIFNKYLDEFIYFFETTEYDTLVIEDLDSFENSNEIFTKLRELNKLINDCETICKKIKFIYAIREDTFEEKEKTKFFDFIIPIIPVINTINSKEILIDKLKENNLYNELDLEYIKDIALYIDDMRTLNNIVNEFNIYREVINISNLIQEKLFSIVILKNMYPKEFAGLQEGKGIIYDIFHNKKERIDKYKEKVKGKPNDITEEMSIVTLIEKCGVEEILTEEERKNNMILYMIANQYIDEEYEEYMNYFYEGTLKRSDKEFLMAIKSKRKMPYDYRLIEIKEILNNLKIESFERKNILNFELVDYILKNKEIYKQQLSSILLQIKNNNDDTIEFCTKYIERNKNTKIFINELSKCWNDMWNYIHFNGSEETKKIYLYNIVKYADVSTIERINKLGLLKEDITEMEDFIEMFKEQEEIMSAELIITFLQIKFQELSGKGLETKLGEFIIDNECYNINENTISAILESKYGMNQKEINTKNYSSIIKTENKKLIEYIEDNIKEYIADILLNENIEINDDEEDILKLLNNEKVSKETKQKIIEKSNVTISNIEDVNLELWKYLIESNKIDSTWNNVIDYYYEKEELGEELIKYINDNSKELSKNSIEEADNFAVEVQQEFCDDIIDKENVKEDIIRSLTSFNINEDILKTKLSKNRIELMIEGEMLPMRDTTYVLLRNNYKGLLAKYIAIDPSFFVENQGILEYDREDIKGILTNEDISEENKLDIISNLDAKIKCRNNEEARIFYNLIIDNDRAISFKLLKNLLEYLDEEKAVRLIINQADELDEKSLTECLRGLKKPYNEITTKNGVPKIKKNKLTGDFVRMLKNKKISYISSIAEKNGYYIVYKIRK